MKKISVFLGLLSIISGHIIFQSAQAQASCQSNVDKIANEIRAKGTSVRVKVYLDYETEQLNNTRRSGLVYFIMDRPGSPSRESAVADNIISSPVLMKSYAARIFASCYGTGFVTFEVDFTRKFAEVFATIDSGALAISNFAMTDDGLLVYSKCSYNPEEITNRVSPISGPGLIGGYCAYVIPDF